MKRLKFWNRLVPLVLSGEKVSTWRVKDDKDLQVGDILSFVITETLDEFAQATITEVRERTFETLTEEDWEGHERFESDEAMMKAYREYYGEDVNMQTPIKIVYFKLL